MSDADASPYDAKPWLKLYNPGHPAAIIADPSDGLSLFRHAVEIAADGPAVLYFDGRLSYRELDEMSDALAAALIDRGFAKGDRLAVYLQNTPAFPLAVLGTWKAGGIVTPINPMNREREVGLIFADSEPKALVALDTLYAEVIAPLPADIPRPEIVITVKALSFQKRDDKRVMPTADLSAHTAEPPDLIALCAEFRGRKPGEVARPQSDDVAFLVYTSGTTGAPKAATNTHGNIAFNGQAIRRWYDLRQGDPVLALAPLFHVTGLVAHLVLPWALAGPTILFYRFEPGVALDAIAEHKPAWTVSAITAFIALMNDANCTRERFVSFRAIVSGGAPIPPSVVETFEARTGCYIHNGYGLTESSAGVIAVPLSGRAPVDPVSGALAIGVPKFGLDAWIADDDGRPAPVGHIGELVLSGPAIVPGYWRKPAETAESMRSDGFRTGDVAFMDSDGWFYLVDRKKDVIIASGFKVWPREVEDVIYAHPAVREVAVIGVKDPYRGETVKAFVSMKPGRTATAEELTEWCRPRMAAYKRPHAIEIREQLPKTVTGKILRRLLT
jgi:long-chain acyl-CoA synthetase